MKKVYISLPMTGKDEKSQRGKVERVASGMHGCKVIDPFYLSDLLEELYKQIDRIPKYEDFLLWDLKVISTCDAIFLCKEWEKSYGCKIEKVFAESIGLEILYEEE